MQRSLDVLSFGGLSHESSPPVCLVDVRRSALPSSSVLMVHLPSPARPSWGARQDSNLRPADHKPDGRYHTAPPCIGREGLSTAARSVLSELARRELGYFWFDQPLEVGVPDAHGVGVGAGPENYDLVFR